MRVLVLGATGMLGHKVYQHMLNRAEVFAGLRTGSAASRLGLFGDASRLLAGLDAEVPQTLLPLFDAARPDVVINCVGVVKQLKEARDPIKTLMVNALFPHRVAEVCRDFESRLIHISTDCVFSGERGNYSEEDISDARDLYGRTKFLGEVATGGCLTLRTSVIGRELASRNGLLEWFLSQRGKRVSGYTRAIFSGVTTSTLAQMLWEVIANHPNLRGLYHLAAEPVAKFDLLVRIRAALNLDIDIVPSAKERCDASLDGRRFEVETGLTVPSWAEMVDALAADPTPYDEWRSTHATTP